jgi:hypothetical protein
VLFGSDGDAVGDYSAENLADAVEGEPDVDAASLFLFCVPLRVLVEVGEWRGYPYLRSQQSKTRRNSSLKNTKHKPNRNSTRVIFNSSEAAKNQPPDQNTSRGIFAERKTLKKTVGRIFPREVSYHTWSEHKQARARAGKNKPK